MTVCGRTKPYDAVAPLRPAVDVRATHLDPEPSFEPSDIKRPVAESSRHMIRPYHCSEAGMLRVTNC